MARGMILGLALFIGASASALTEVEKCARKADRIVKRVYKGYAVERVEFRNTTPGSYDQEYVGVYRIGSQTEELTFYSPFICDRLRLVQ